MSSLLELLGNGLQSPFMELVLPHCQPLSVSEEKMLAEELELQPGHIANKLRLGIHYAQSGLFEQAEYVFTQILEKNPRHTDARLAWAAMHFSDGSLDDAREQLLLAQMADEPDSRVLFALGHYHERLGQINEALEFYLKACAVPPYLRQVQERLGAIYLRLDDYNSAIEQYENLKTENPEDICIYIILGQLQLQVRKYKDAAASFERALTIEPDNFELHDEKIETMAQAGQVTEAIEAMRAIIDDQGDFADSYVRLADLYSQAANDQAAVMTYLRALELHPGYLEAAVKLGTQHLRMQRFYEAAVNFNQAIEINDRLITGYVGLGIAQIHNKDEKSGQDTLDLALALEPNTNLLFVETGRLQLKVALAQKQQKDYLEIEGLPESTVENELDELVNIQLERHCAALRQNPNQADLLYRYGLLLRGQGKTDEAIQQFQTALQINPSYTKARIKLGLALREKGKIADGFDQLEKAMVLEKEFIDMHYRLGLMYCDRMQFALALEHFDSELAENNDNDNDNIQANLMLALQNMGLIDRGAANWRALCELEPQSALAFQAQRSLKPLKPVR